MKISEIQPPQKAGLNGKATVILSSEAKKSLDLIASVKRKTVSALVREIIDDFLANNVDELQKLG